MSVTLVHTHMEMGSRVFFWVSYNQIAENSPSLLPTCATVCCSTVQRYEVLFHHLRRLSCIVAYRQAVSDLSQEALPISQQCFKPFHFPFLTQTVSSDNNLTLTSMSQQCLIIFQATPSPPQCDTLACSFEWTIRTLEMGIICATELLHIQNLIHFLQYSVIE